MKSGSADAVQWFRRTRALAREGFVDSLGMAADSYGWEARSEWKQGHPEKAAPLYLTQLALGDESAVYSLKALIPDREPVDGMLNYGPEAGERARSGARRNNSPTSKKLPAPSRQPPRIRFFDDWSPRTFSRPNRIARISTVEMPWLVHTIAARIGWNPLRA